MKTNVMELNLFSLRTYCLWKSARAFLLFFFLLIGGKAYSQYSGTGTFTKVTAAAGFTDGYYVVAYGTTQAMNNTHNGTYFANTAISPTSGTTITNPSKAIVWKIETNGTGKSIYNEEGNVFASYTGSSNNVQAVSTATTNNQRWSFTYSGGTFDVQNLGVSGRSLQYNTSNPRFACYTGSQQDITLYKLTVTATPTLTVTPVTITLLDYVQGSGPSAAQSYNLKGANLSAGVTVTAPTNFEVSRTSTGTYTGSISYTAAEGNVSAGQTVYVRLKSGLTAATYGGTATYVTNVSTGAATGNVSVSGAVSLPATYVLTYNGNDQTSDASTVPANDSFTGGQNPGVLLAAPAALSKTGYTLASWYSITNGVTGGVINTLGANYGPAPMPNSNITIYARWSFSVAYNNNEGAGAISSQTSYYNGTAGVKSGTLLLSTGSTLSRAGYTFGGWKTNAAGTAPDYTAGAVYTHSGSSAAVTLYAHWIKKPPKFAVTPTSLSGFTYSESNGPSGVQSFVLSGSDLENTNTDPVELVTIDDRFEIAETAVGPYSQVIELPSSYVGTSKTFYVRLKAGLTTNANYTDTVLVSGGSALEANYAEVILSGNVAACLAPATQSSVAAFSSVTTSGMTVNLTAGNGVGRVVVINKTNSFTNPVSSNALPVADTVYGGVGEQVVFTGTGNSVAVTGLVPSTAYYVRVYEYNICSNNYIYNTTTITNNPRNTTTACQIPINPNGEITPLENPACSTAILVYELSDPKEIGVTYYWQTTATGTSTANPVVFANDSVVSDPYSVFSSGNYYVRAFNGFCWSAASYVTQTPITILSAPTITTQPTNESVAVGANAIFTVVASGSSPFTYQWQESLTADTGTWTNVGISNTLTLTNASLEKNGYKYRVIVSNDCGSKISNTVTLSVSVQPVSIWSNEITVTNPSATNPYTSGDIKNTNIAVSGITRGSGLTAASASGRFSASGWSTAATLDTNDYFEFVLTPGNNYKIDFNAFEYTGQASGTGPASFVLKSSIDNYVGNIGTANAGGTTISLSAAAYQNITTPVRFRLYGYNAGASTGTFSVNDFDFTGNVSLSVPACTPATITAFPTTGPANTVVNITGTDFTVASTVKFGSAVAVVEFISATQLKAIVPATANGNIFVDTTLDCDSETAFTLIKEEVSGCESISGGVGNVNASDIILYEVYDENGGNGGVVTLYNRTGASVNLTGYSIYRATDYGGTYTTYGNLSGTIAAGAVAVIGVSASKCGYTPTGNGNFGATGFNANDGFQLRKGTVIIDDFKAPNYTGYYLKRKNEFLSPKATFVESEWTAQNIATDECLAGVVAQEPASKIPPVITVQPSYAVNCDVVNASLALTATEGYIGGNTLAYQWYELKNSGAWAAITDGGVYSGATSRTLTINNIDGLNNYQYYCQVRENTQTCYTATQATQIKEAANTWASNVWTNGKPVLGSKVIISGSYDSQTNGVLDVCDLTINSGGSMRVKPNFPVAVKKKIKNNGTAASFIVESDANLIQTDNVANEGDIQVQRSVTDMNNNAAAAIDYVYWGSPVSGQAVKGANGFSPDTPANGYLQYNESNDKFAVTNDATFQIGKGYAIRAETGTNGYSKTYQFKGVPNNGNLQYQNLKWTDANHGFNLVGNPYPSNIDFDLLFQMNAAKMYSTVWFWTNNSYTAAQVGSGYNGNNYAVYNGTGGSPATYNPENPYDGSVIPNGKIKVGQAFIVQSKAAGKDQPLDFTNSIRVTENGNFYQKSNPKNRFWLTMTSPSNLVNTILIGYIEGATNNYETDFDGELFAIGSDSFYSILGAKKLAIQGKSNQFSTDDVVSVGNTFATDGTYKIKLQMGEGIFENNQKIYLRDKVLDKYFDLTNDETYTFTASKGVNTTRFDIVYKSATLAVGNDKKSEFQIYRNGENFVIQSSEILGNVELYDSGGRLLRQLYSKERNAIINASALLQGLYIIKSENSGKIRTKKVIK